MFMFPRKRAFPNRDAKFGMTCQVYELIVEPTLAKISIV